MSSRRPRARAARLTPPDPDARMAARSAGLRYTSDALPGIRRVRAGKGFRYVDAHGAPVRAPEVLERIRRLAVPPAYRDVWISPDPDGHLQATGRDARGRKQYRYHPRWRAVRDETKFDRMLAFSRALPRIRRRVRRELARPGLPAEKVVAAVVQLLGDTCIRVGNEEYARANDSYGLTTLRDQHVEVEGSTIRFEFRGKRGKQHVCTLRDRRLARVVARCQALPGEELFQYVDLEGQRRTITSGDVNDWLRAAAGEEFTAKDFRTWSGTLLASRALLAAERASTARQRKHHVLAAFDAVAVRLNNTRAVSRKYYVHPAVVEAYEDGSLERDFRRAEPAGLRGLTADERALVAFLEARVRRSSVRTARAGAERSPAAAPARTRSSTARVSAWRRDAKPSQGSAASVARRRGTVSTVKRAGSRRASSSSQRNGVATVAPGRARIE
jgi:DNA topoisomerase-1